MTIPTEADSPRNPTRLILGSRGSPLALAQARWVQARLGEKEPGSRPEIRIIRTEGDRSQSVPLASGTTVGIFVREIEEELLSGRIDLAVHSLKDLPTAQPAGLEVAAIPAREDPRDVLVLREGKGLDDLPPEAVVGTGSPRRIGQIRAVRPDLRFEAIRGNVDTRIRKLREGRVAALVLAAAGLNRLGIRDITFHPFPLEMVLPAPGQGALGIEIRSGDGALARSSPARPGSPAQLRRRPGRAGLPEGARGRMPAARGIAGDGGGGRAEAAGRRRRGGRIRCPPGRGAGPRPLCGVGGGEARPSDAPLRRRRADGPDAAGSREMSGPARGTLPLSGRRILVTRSPEQAGEFSDLLRDLGAEVLEVPLIRFEPPDSWEAADRAISRLGRYSLIVFTSANAVECLPAPPGGERPGAGRPLPDPRWRRWGRRPPGRCAGTAWPWRSSRMSSWRRDCWRR